MLDVGWTEMLVIAIVMIVVVGPKELPGMLRTFGRTAAKLRSMAGDFQRQFNDALKEAELDDVKKSVDELRGLNPKEQIRKHINPFEKAAADVRAGIDSLKAQPPKPAEQSVHPAEPIKTGPVENPELPSSSAAVQQPVAAVAEAAKPKATPAPRKAPAAKKAAPKGARKSTKSAKTST